MKKIYLSPAAHAHDNSTKCPMSCGENVHCNQYMDILETRLKELGFDVKRGDKALTGSTAMNTRVSEANKWGADLYYVAHTNAGGGRYSMTMYYTTSATGKKWADILHSYRKSANGGNHKVKANSGLYELKGTSMVSLYDELFFHDNAEDCAWFHNGGMKEMAEEAAHAFCDIFGVQYKPHADSSTSSEKIVEKVDATYQVWDADKKAWLPNVTNKNDYAGRFGHSICALYISLSLGNVTYKVHTLNGKWLPEVTNRSDYAGIFNKPIDGLMIKTDNGHKLHYQVHTKNGKWLGDVSGYDEKNTSTGFAGIFGQPIDAVYVWVDPIEKTVEVKDNNISQNQDPIPQQPSEEPVITTPVPPTTTPPNDTDTGDTGEEKDTSISDASDNEKDHNSTENTTTNTSEDTTNTSEDTSNKDTIKDDDEISDNVFLHALKTFIQIFIKWFKKQS